MLTDAKTQSGTSERSPSKFKVIKSTDTDADTKTDNYYSGFPMETPELKFRLRFFFFFFLFSHSLQFFNKYACAKILLMSTWHGVMTDGEEFMRWKINTNTVYNTLQTDTKYHTAFAVDPH